MRRFVLALGFLAFAASALAQRLVDRDGRVIQIFPYKDHPAIVDAPAARTNNLINHGGPVMANPQVVSIFWGSKWNTDAAHIAVKTDLPLFFANFGSTGEWRTINQYGVNTAA